MTEVSTTNNWARALWALLGAGMLITLAACGGGGTGSTSPLTPADASLTVTPSTVAMDFGSAPVTLVVSGGVKPYALTSSLQSLIPVGGIPQDGRFTITPAYAPDIATVVTLTIRDGQQNTVTAEITVNGRLGVALAVSPATADAGINVPVTFTITGGSTPYTVTSSQPNIIPNPIAVDAFGRFTVTPISNPPVAATVVLTIRDSRNATTTATVNVRTLALAVSPSTATTTFGVPVVFQLSGGQAPYSVTSNFPSLVANPAVDANGRFTATPLLNPSTATSVVLTVRDASGNTASATLQITPLPLSVIPSAVQVAANVPVTFTITGGSAPFTVVSSQPNLVPNPASVDAQGRFILRAVATPLTATEVLITVRDSGNSVATITMTVLPTSPIPLIVLPQTSTVFFNNPATLTIFGGAPPYQAFSTNPVVLPVTRNVVGDQILLSPANVDVATTVTITVVDSLNATTTATVNVNPAPLLNTLTITPTPASPGAGCGSAVCAGQTASVTVTVRNVSGAGLQGRAVRFENVQGNYQFITSGPGLPETLANSITVTTGQDGLAIVRLRADVNAPTQVALIRATELTTGNVLNSSFVIAQFTDGAGTLTAIPTTWTLTGPDVANCASNIPVTYYIFGGTPPYRIQSTLPNYVNIVPPIVQTNGGGFTAIPTGTVCTTSAGAQITITDATGRTIAVTLINTFGTGNPPTNFNAISVVPGDVPPPGLACGQSIVETIQGGEIKLADGTTQQPTFVVSTSAQFVTATLSGRSITVTRTNEGTTSSPAVIFVSNGVSTVQFSVAVTTNCGASVLPIEFTPPSPLVVACATGSTGSTTLTALPPGSTYSATPFTGLTVDPSVTSSASSPFTLNGLTLTVRRTTTVTAGSPSIPVIVSNGSTTATLLVAPPVSCGP